MSTDLSKPRRSTYAPAKDCPKCEGAGGWYWDAPIYHNDTQREWKTCDCWRCMECGAPGYCKCPELPPPGEHNVVRVDFKAKRRRT